MLGNYNGGKGNIFRHLINQIPPHRSYTELFLGGGSVMLHKKAAAENIGIDMDAAVIAEWRQWAGAPAPPATNDGTGTHRHNQRCQLTPLDAAVAAATAKSTSATAKSGDSLEDTTINGVTEATPQTAILANTATNRGARYQFLHMDALAWLDTAVLAPIDFVNADPPYLMHTRSYRRPLYNHEFSTIAEHTSLINRLRALNCMVMLHGYDSQLYRDMLSDWRILEIPTRNRAGAAVTEIVWMNYPEPNRLHDYAWLGDDYREREKLNKRKKRLIRKLRKMPRLERLSLMAAVDEAGLLNDL